MADESDDTPPLDEDGGGEVKSFLEHLEDLRWTLIKSATAIGIGMLLCLIAGDRLMAILKWPLERSFKYALGDKQTVAFLVGTNLWGRFHVNTNQPVAIDLGTNKHVVFELEKIVLGTNEYFVWKHTTRALDPRQVDSPIKLLNLKPAGGFFVAFQLAMYGGIVLASPWVLYYFAQFILPALKIKEKKYLFRGFIIGTGLFFLGVTFCYFVLMPLALNASAKYSQWLGISADQWTAEDYISFVCKFMLGMGLGFELPVAVLILVKLGLVNYRQLAAFRRYMIVINLVLGALLTTPEVLTQVMMALPLQILYEVSVWIAWYWERQEKKREAKLGLTTTGTD